MPYRARDTLMKRRLRERTLSEHSIMRKKYKQKGVTIVEYAIMLALIAVAVAVAAPSLTSAVVGVFSKASSVMNK